MAYATNGGSINLGLNENYLKELDYNYITVANTNVDFNGDLITDETGCIKMGIGGIGVFTGNITGNVSVYADNGATWNGTVKGDTASLRLNSGSLWNITENSKTDLNLKTLTGSESIVRRGYISMTDSNVNIGKYSGNTTFTYKHSDVNPTTIIGGNVVINSAEPLKLISLGIGDATQKAQASEMNSTVTIATSSAGIDTTNQETINLVLNNLAEKLFYLGYAKGERNLTGTVEIAEGLTSTSVSKYYSDISFDEKTGQAKKDVTTYNPYTAMISGNTAGDAEYAAVFDKENMSYKFDKDTYINNKVTGTGSAMGSYYYGAINNYGDKPFNTSAAASANGPSYTIDMQGHNLGIEMNAFPASGSTGNQPMWTTAGILACREGTITIDNPGAISIKASANYYYGSAIRSSTAAVTDAGAHVTVNKDAVGADSLYIDGNSKVAVNVKDGSTGTNEVKIDGDIFSSSKISNNGYTASKNSTVDLALTTGSSYFNGLSSYTYSQDNDDDSTTTVSHGTVNMWLQNGATWINKKYGNADYDSGFSGSALTKLIGGADTASAGTIFQKDNKDIKIDNYSGYTTVLFTHDSVTPTTINGGNVKIGSASVGSSIALRTDYDANMSDADKNALNVNISKEYSAFETNTMAPVQKKIQKAIAKVAKSNGIQSVVNSNSMLFGGKDLTEEVVKAL